jgi:hypothetical protein
MVLDRKVSRGKVLYLALEDSARRIKSRMQAQHAGPADITFVTEWSTFGQGGMVRLQDGVKDHEFTLVVIDTMSRAAGMADQRDPAQMTVLYGELQRLATEHSLTILLVDHHRKTGTWAPNPIDDVMESTAKTAVIDTAWGLYKERGKQGATLMVTGRDIEERDLALSWDGLTCTWQCLGDAHDVREETVKGQILQAIDDLEELGELATTTNVAQHIGKDRGNVGKAMADLLNEGRVTKGKKDGRQQPYKRVHTSHI